MYCTVVLDCQKGTFQLESNIEMKDVRDFIIDWMRTDIGKGEDNRELQWKENYYISIYKNGSGYEVEDNCNNRDLRRGILGAFIKDFKNIRKEYYKEI